MFPLACVKFFLILLFFVGCCRGAESGGELFEINGAATDTFLINSQVGLRLGKGSQGQSGGAASENFFSELFVQGAIANPPSVYHWVADGRYGRRLFSNDEIVGGYFYDAGVSLGTERRPLFWSSSIGISRTLRYRTAYNSESEMAPSSILVRQANTRRDFRFRCSYDRKLFTKTSIVPEFRFSEYWQEDVNSENVYSAQSYETSLELMHQYSAITRVGVGSGYKIQVNRRETGRVDSVFASFDYKLSEKTALNSRLGYSWASYKESGGARGLNFRCKGDWGATEKLNVYVFGESSFKPGYGGGAARKLYRLGYGTSWLISDRSSVSLALLHDYQMALKENVNNPDSYGEVRHFLSLTATHSPVDRLRVNLGFRYEKDEFPDAQTEVFLSAVYDL